MNFWDNLIPEAREGILAINTVEDIPLFFEKLDIIQSYNYDNDLHYKKLLDNYIPPNFTLNYEKYPWSLFYEVLNEFFRLKVISCTSMTILISLILKYRLNEIARIEHYITVKEIEGEPLDLNNINLKLTWYMIYNNKNEIYHYIPTRFNINSPRSLKFKEAVITAPRLDTLNFDYTCYRYKIDSVYDSLLYYVKEQRELLKEKAIFRIYKYNEYEMPWFNYGNVNFLKKLFTETRPLYIISPTDKL